LPTAGRRRRNHVLEIGGLQGDHRDLHLQAANFSKRAKSIICCNWRTR
jgi:hypothetical protein